MTTTAIRDARPEEPVGSERPRRRWWWGALAGAVAVAAALGMAELVTGVLEGTKTSVVSVGEVVVENAPSWLKDFAIETLRHQRQRRPDHRHHHQPDRDLDHPGHRLDPQALDRRDRHRAPRHRPGSPPPSPAQAPAPAPSGHRSSPPSPPSPCSSPSSARGPPGWSSPISPSSPLASASATAPRPTRPVMGPGVVSAGRRPHPQASIVVASSPAPQW